MQKQLTQPKLVIHGGIFSHLETLAEHHLEQKFHEALVSIVMQSYDVLCSVGARTAVLHSVRCLEDEPLFNAGTGSTLQADGQVRMSAALMDSDSYRFLGVINIQNVRNPIDVANLLIKERSNVLAGELATTYARQQRVPVYDPITLARQGWYEKTCLHKYGTVGVVALDAEGVICVGTSTGGIGCEIPGRVSDSATVAGTYASALAGVSCTGVGEHIINHAVAARVITRVEDGLSLQAAVDKTLQEARTHDYRFGLISLDARGNVVIGKTLQEDYAVVYASYDGQLLSTFP